MIGYCSCIKFHQVLLPLKPFVSQIGYENELTKTITTRMIYVYFTMSDFSLVNAVPVLCIHIGNFVYSSEAAE